MTPGTTTKIGFPSPEEEGRGVLELARRVRVIAAREEGTNCFVVPTSALAVLRQTGIQFEAVGAGGMGYAVQRDDHRHLTEAGTVAG